MKESKSRLAHCQVRAFMSITRLISRKEKPKDNKSHASGKLHYQLIRVGWTLFIVKNRIFGFSFGGKDEKNNGRMELQLTLIKGIIAGILISIPLGPMAVLVIQRTLNKGRVSGMVSGLGIAVADTIYACIAAVGLKIILRFIEQQQVYFQILGSLLILVVGIRIFTANPVRQLRMQRSGKRNLFQDFLSTAFMTLSNPFTVFVLIALYAGMNVHQEHLSAFELSGLILAVFGGCLLWWFIISTVAYSLRNRFRLRSLWWMNKITGSVISGFGFFALISIWIF